MGPIIEASFVLIPLVELDIITSASKLQIKIRKQYTSVIRQKWKLLQFFFLLSKSNTWESFVMMMMESRMT